MVIGGSFAMNEVVFFHRATRTLVLTDLVEWIGDQTPDVPLALRLWWARCWAAA